MMSFDIILSWPRSTSFHVLVKSFIAFFSAAVHSGKSSTLLYDTSTVGIDTPAALSAQDQWSRVVVAPFVSCCQHFYINCLFAQTQFLGGLTLRTVPSLRSLAVSSGILNQAETALVLPKCSPAFALTLATHQRHKTHTAKIPCAQTEIFTQQFPLLVDPLSTWADSVSLTSKR